MNEQQALELKAKGIIPQKQEGFLVLRFLSRGGYFTVEEMNHLNEIATTYGDGRIGLTSRLTIELNYIPEEKLEEVLAKCQAYGLRIGGGGPNVRAVLTCKGTVCKHGLADTNALTLAIEKQYFAMPLPGKFKIAVLGCSNSYGKAQGNDLSLLAVRKVDLAMNQCVGCNKCIKVCPEDAFLETADHKVSLIEPKCTQCGKCLPVCPTNALTSGDVTFLALIGGRLGM